MGIPPTSSSFCTVHSWDEHRAWDAAPHAFGRNVGEKEGRKREGRYIYISSLCGYKIIIKQLGRLKRKEAAWGKGLRRGESLCLQAAKEIFPCWRGWKPKEKGANLIYGSSARVC